MTVTYIIYLFIYITWLRMLEDLLLEDVFLVVWSGCGCHIQTTIALKITQADNFEHAYLISQWVRIAWL